MSTRAEDVYEDTYRYWRRLGADMGLDNSAEAKEKASQAVQCHIADTLSKLSDGETI